MIAAARAEVAVMAFAAVLSLASCGRRNNPSDTDQGQPISQGRLSMGGAVSLSFQTPLRTTGLFHELCLGLPDGYDVDIFKRELIAPSEQDSYRDVTGARDLLPDGVVRRRRRQGQAPPRARALAVRTAP